jgi:hypothetical protein
MTPIHSKPSGRNAQAPQTIWRVTPLCGILFVLGACRRSGFEPTPYFSIGGTVAGLNGTVVVQNNGGENLTLTADGSFTFPSVLPDGSAYALTVLTNPSSPVHQTCTPSNASGTTKGANVTNIAIVCSTNSYTVGGSVAGLTGTAVLQNNAGDVLSLSANGSFTFATSVADTASYHVTILNQPARQTCSAINSSGTVNGNNVTNVTVTCSTNFYTVGGTVSGLSGTAVIQKNGADNSTITANGPFMFATPIAEGTPYNVTVQTQPVGQTCSVSNGSGTTGGSNITSVSVNCVDKAFAYVTPLSPDAANVSQIRQYLLSQDGLLSSYEDATQTAGHHGQMTFASVNGTQYAYILEDGVTYCSVDSDGAFNNCRPTTAPITGMNHPRSIAFAAFNNQQYAYLSDPSSSSLFQCTVDTTSGDLLSCLEYFDGNIDAAYGIAFNTAGNGVQHAYVADAATGLVVCSIDATGSFMNPPGCVATPSFGAPSWIPYSIEFITAGGTRYAYVADNGTSAGNGQVYRCLLNADGTFQNNGCVATPTDTSSLGTWNPYFIAFKKLNGTQYAYVVNNQSVNIGSIYRCTVDEATGLLTQDCIKTPDLPPDRDAWQPSGIAFR